MNKKFGISVLIEDVMSFITVDIGGSRMRAALYPETGINALQVSSISTRGEGTTLDRLMLLIDSMRLPGQEVKAIAVAVPGLVAPVSGVIQRVVNIADWDGLPLVDLLASRFQVPVRIGNDANLAALGELFYGAGRGQENLLYLTISTGIGAGVIVNGQLLTGSQGLAAEIGHITVQPDGPVCSCGQRGHLEAICSGPAIVRYVVEGMHFGIVTSLRGKEIKLDANRVAEAARLGDELSIEAFRNAGSILGRAIADLLHIFNPGAVILGGGVIGAGSLLLEPMERSLRETVLSEEYLHGLLLTTAELGDNSGLLGALAVIRTRDL